MVSMFKKDGDRFVYQVPSYNFLELKSLRSLTSVSGGGRRIHLGNLTTTDHPCLVDREFSIYKSRDVGPLIFNGEMLYSLDLDGFVVLAK